MRVHTTSLGRMVMFLLSTVFPVFSATTVLLTATPAAAIGNFSPSMFHFATIVADDGKDEAAGWQVASAQLDFVDARLFIPRIWSCSLRIGMPLRAAAYGSISPESAADMTASVATEASTAVMHRQSEWMTAAFCIAFASEMKKLFLRDHQRLGATVNGP